MKEPIRELRCHYLVTCVHNNETYHVFCGKLEILLLKKSQMAKDEKGFQTVIVQIEKERCKAFTEGWMWRKI